MDISIVELLDLIFRFYQFSVVMVIALVTFTTPAHPVTHVTIALVKQEQSYLSIHNHTRHVCLISITC